VKKFKTSGARVLRVRVKEEKLRIMSWMARIRARYTIMEKLGIRGRMIEELRIRDKVMESFRILCILIKKFRAMSREMQQLMTRRRDIM
jgi:hypothetical protein